MKFRWMAIALVTAALTACGSKDDGVVESPIVEGVNFVGMAVSDIEQSSKLYAEATDLATAWNGSLNGESVFEVLTGRPKVSASAKLMRSVNAQLLYMEFDDQSDAARRAAKVEAYGPGIAHVCYQVNKSTQAYEKLLEGGATHIGEPAMVQLNPRNPVEYAYARDHDDIMFEVEHVDVAALELPEPPKNNYRIRHVSLATQDMDRIVKFYSHFMQQSKPRRAGRFWKLSGEKLDMVSGLPGSKIEMAWFQTRNLELEIIEYVSHSADAGDQPRPVDALGYNMIVFDVSDLAQARARFIAAGGEIVADNQQLLGSEIVFGRDPDGNLIGMQNSASDSLFSSKHFKNNGL